MDAWTLDYLAAFARAELIDPVRYQPAFQSPNTTWNYDFSDPQKPVFTGAGVNLPASAFTFLEWAQDNGLNTEDETTVLFNALRDVEFGRHSGHIKGGVKYRMKERTVDIGSIARIPGNGPAITLAEFARTSERGVTPTFPSINPEAFRTFYYANESRFGVDAEATRLNDTIEDYETDEDVLAAYAMADVALGKLTLITGVRMEQTEYANRAWSVEDEDPDTLTQVGAERSYTNFMPGLIGRYDFNPRLIGRASYTNTLARPKFLDATAGRTVEDDDVTQGNPELEPYRSNNWDASLEFYPKSLGVFTVGVFHKDIQDFIFSQVIPGGAPNGINSLTTPLNGESASVTGLEVDMQQQFTALPPPFDGFGIYANVTLTDSESVLGGSRQGETVPFLNQSKKLANFALSYEKHNFFARVSLTHRSRYLALIGASTSGDQYVEDHSQVDISTNFKISPQDHRVCRVSQRDERAVLGRLQRYRWTAQSGVLQLVGERWRKAELLKIVRGYIK